MFEWLFNADTGVFLGAFGLIMGVASLIYARSQAKGANAQAKSATKQAAEALLAAELVAKGAREQALEALHAAGLVAENARVQAVQALTAAGLVAENARLQATQALRAAELVANSAVSARLREMRARNFQFNPTLPVAVRSMMTKAGGADAYGLWLDAIDIAQEIHSLRKGGVVSDDHWRMWMNDQIRPMAASDTFKAVFQHAVKTGSFSGDFVTSFEQVFAARPIDDPWAGSPIAEVQSFTDRNGTVAVSQPSVAQPGSPSSRE